MFSDSAGASARSSLAPSTWLSMPQRRSIADLRRSQSSPAASSASISPPSVRMPRSSPASCGDLLPQRDGAGRQRQRVRRLAAILRRLVGEVVRQQLHVQAAGIRGARRHAGLVAFREQHVDAVLGQEIRAAQPGETAADHQHVATPCLLRQRRQPVQVHRRVGQLRAAAPRTPAPRTSAVRPAPDATAHAARRTRNHPAHRDRAARSWPSRSGPGSGPCRRASPSSAPAATSGRRPVPRAAGRRLPPRSDRRWSRR